MPNIIKNIFEKRMIILYSAIVMLLLLIASYPTAGINGNEIGNLTKGKNYFNFTASHTFAASQLIILNPEIEVISYYDSREERNISYVNAFGGVGRNFLVNSGTIYEIYASANMTLEAP